jgi:hypothetical protein
MNSGKDCRNKMMQRNRIINFLFLSDNKLSIMKMLIITT